MKCEGLWREVGRPVRIGKVSEGREKGEGRGDGGLGREGGREGKDG